MGIPTPSFSVGTGTTYETLGRPGTRPGFGGTTFPYRARPTLLCRLFPRRPGREKLRAAPTRVAELVGYRGLSLRGCNPYPGSTSPVTHGQQWVEMITAG